MTETHPGPRELADEMTNGFVEEVAAMLRNPWSEVLKEVDEASDTKKAEFAENTQFVADALAIIENHAVVFRERLERVVEVLK